jgi:8-oxo-dGTP pyrophosphatase MutT (NUDIX family)
MTRYPTRRATSAGGLVVDERPDGPWVVLIAHRSTGGDLQWTLPKGGIEEGESLETAAVREVREETGLEAEVVRKLGVVDYWFVWRPDKVRYHKFVHYFLMAHRGGDMSARDDEAEDVAWLPIADALQRLSHPNERDLVVAAELDADAATGPAADAGGAEG